MAKSTSTKLKQLPWGEGNMSITKAGTIEYKKVIKLEDGSHVRKSVNGRTQRECLDKMKAVEIQLLKEGPKRKYRRILKDELLSWLEKVKKPVLKVQSYQRLKSTINNQIINSPIGHLRYQSVRTEELQNLMDILNEAGLSHSTIKKTYDCLNEFYRYVSARDKFDNPMLLVIMPTVNNVHAVSKEISFFEEDDIKKLIEEAGIRYHTGRLKYRYGYIICANMYLGLRIWGRLFLRYRGSGLFRIDISFFKYGRVKKRPWRVLKSTLFSAHRFAKECYNIEL